MTLPTEALGVITALATVITTMAGVVYRELRAQITDRDRRIAILEAAAVEMSRAKDVERVEALRAKDAELAEWRRAAQTKNGDR